MTTGKISRADVAAQLNRLGGTQTTSPVAKTEELAKSTEPENLFGARSAHNERPKGEGQSVSRTATASALWGQAAMEGSKPPLNVLTLKNLTPEQAKAKLAELQKKQAAIEGRIQGRAEELDKHWRYMRLTKRTEALKSYLAQTPNLPPEKRAELETAIARSEAVQEKIDALQQDVKGLKPQPDSKKPGTPEERTALARKILAARREHSEAVKSGTETVDGAGLHIERLALTENLIDPSGGATSQYGSMIGLVGQFFECSYMMSTLDQLYFGPMAMVVKEMTKEAADAQKRQRIEDSWRERDDLMRQMLKDLAAKTQLQKSTVEAVKTRNPAKMSAATATKLHHDTKAS